MKRVLFLLVFVAAIAALCTPSFAAQQIAAGAGDTPLGDSTGVLDGVEMTGPGTTGTLIVGAQNVFTNNILLDPLALPAIWSDTASQGNITFNNASIVYGDIGKSGAVMRNITAGASGATDRFLGSVYATELGIGTGRVDLESGTITNTITKTIFTGVGGRISLAPHTSLTSALTTTAGDNRGTLILGDGSHLTGAVGAASAGLASINVEGDNVSATITGAVEDVHAFSLLTNTLNIGGALTIATDGVINTTLASQTIYGHIVVAAGNASNLGTGLTVKVTVPSTVYIPKGGKFYIVRSESGTGALATVTRVDPTNPLYTFSVDTTATDGDATITMLQAPLQAPLAPPPGETLPPVAPVAATVADVLEDIPSAPDIDAVRATINALTTTTAVVNAEAQLAPSTPALAAPLETFYAVRQFQNLWSSRLDMCSQDVNQSPDANCQDNEPRSGWWVKGFGYEGHQNARQESTGYTSRVLGTMIAYDRPFGENTRGGLGFGYARGSINGKTFDASIDFDTYRLEAYIGHERGPWFVHGSASVGWNEYSSMRHIVYTGMDRRAKAKYRGQDYTGFVSTGYHFYAKKFIITPLASLQYTKMHLNGYTETGAGDVNLKAKSQSYDFLESGLGVKVERPFSDSRGRKYVPEMHFNWFHELSNPRPEQTTKYTAAGSSSFKTKGIETDNNMFNVGGGLTLLSCVCNATTWSLEAVYDYYLNNTGYTANQITVRFTSRF